MTSIASLSATPQPLAQPEPSGKQDLGQQDFLTLMTAQLQNQDPFAPMENGEFLAQMAQFSTVSGLDTVNETLGQISSQIGGGQISTASSLLDRQVLVPGTVARPDADGAIHGVAELPAATAGVTVTYSDAKTGAPLHTQEMGAQPAGRMSFAWSELPAPLREARGAVRVSVQTDEGGPVAPSVFARVAGVELNEAGQEMTLNVEDYGLRSSLEVTAIR